VPTTKKLRSNNACGTGVVRAGSRTRREARRKHPKDRSPWPMKQNFLKLWAEPQIGQQINREIRGEKEPPNGETSKAMGSE